MFMSPERREAAEIQKEANLATWRRNKWMIFVPLKLIGAAALLSFTYYTGEHAGVEICAPAIIPPK